MIVVPVTRHTHIYMAWCNVIVSVRLIALTVWMPCNAGNVDARSRTRGLEASSGQEEVSDGPPWWERFPDFVPLSALKWGTNPR